MRSPFPRLGSTRYGPSCQATHVELPRSMPRSAPGQTRQRPASKPLASSSPPAARPKDKRSWQPHGASIKRSAPPPISKRPHTSSPLPSPDRPNRTGVQDDRDEERKLPLAL